MSWTLFCRLGIYISKKNLWNQFLVEAVSSLYLEVLHLAYSRDFLLLLLSFVSQKGDEK